MGYTLFTRYDDASQKHEQEPREYFGYLYKDFYSFMLYQQRNNDAGYVFLIVSHFPSLLFYTKVLSNKQVWMETQLTF